MKCIFLLLLVFGMITESAGQKPRIIVTTDIGGDPDDQQSLIRLMLYTNEFDIEGIISSAAGTPGELKENVIRPDLIIEIINAYAEVYPQLIKHHPEYPVPNRLKKVIKKGNHLRGWDHVGPGNDTEASEWIIKMADKSDKRPLNICIFGGQTDLAQALWKVKNSRTSHQYNDFISKLRIYDIADQDGIAERMFSEFPGMFYILNSAKKGEDIRNAAFRGMYLGGDESLTSESWFKKHVLENHGPLGKMYPTKTWTAPNPHGLMKEGDTPSWFYFLENGLNFPEKPEYGGWGGRFIKNDKNVYTGGKDSLNHEINERTTVSRWRHDFQNDFAARLDWCVNDPEKANHAPVITINENSSKSPLYIQVKPGKKIILDASESTDPDKDSLRFEWSVYNEAGNYNGDFTLHSTAPRIVITMPEIQNLSSVHVLLKGIDDGTPNLTSYRRIILTN